jgi:hypothetical protein
MAGSRDPRWADVLSRSRVEAGDALMAEAKKIVGQSKYEERLERQLRFREVASE